MAKAWCVFCEMGCGEPKEGMVWIHDDCFNTITDMENDIKHVKRALEAHKDIKVIEDFLNSMEDFRRRWSNTQKFLKQKEKE